MAKVASPLTWQDEIGLITVAANNGTGTNPTWGVFRGNINAYQFNEAQGDNVWVPLHIRHAYAPGTPVYLHAHWATNSSTSAANDGQTVIWRFDYSIAKGYDAEAFPADASTSVTYTFAGGLQKQYQHMIGEISTPISSASLETDAVILTRVSIDPASTFTGTIFLLMVDMHYQCDNGEGTLGRNTVNAWAKA